MHRHPEIIGKLHEALRGRGIPIRDIDRENTPGLECMKEGAEQSLHLRYMLDAMGAHNVFITAGPVFESTDRAEINRNAGGSSCIDGLMVNL